MAIFNGTELGVYIGGTLIAGSMSVSGLIDYNDSNKDVNDLFTALSDRTALTLKFAKATPVAGEDYNYSATGFITSLEQSGGTEDTATYSASFELSGVITQTAE
jgi:hypothetical protein